MSEKGSLQASRFWEHKSLSEMSDDEWESLCDGCGRCCLVRFQNPDDDSVFYTLASCRLLDTLTCGCTEYRNRFDKVPGCISIRHLEKHNYSWLPPTCAYRLLDEGAELPWWHPLISGSTQSVIDAGISVAGRVFNEDSIHPSEIESLVLYD